LPPECIILEAANEWGVAPWIIEPGIDKGSWLKIWVLYKSEINKKQQRDNARK